MLHDFLKTEDNKANKVLPKFQKVWAPTVTHPNPFVYLTWVPSFVCQPFIYIFYIYENVYTQNVYI